MNKLLSVILILSFQVLLICSEPTNSSNKINVAVAEFEARGISKSEAVTISEFFRTSLVNTHTLSVLDRNNMDTILAEQAFQMTGCTSEECVIKMGKILNVQRMITGIVTNFAPFYYISISVINVETGEIIHSERVKVRNRDDLPDMSDKLATTISERLTGKKPLTKMLPEREVIGIGLIDMLTMFKSGRFITLINQNSPFQYAFNIQSPVLDFPTNNIGLELKYYPARSWFINVSYCPTTTKRTGSLQIDFKSSWSVINKIILDVEQSPLIVAEIGKEFKFSRIFKLFVAGSVISSSLRVSSDNVTYAYDSFLSDNNGIVFILERSQTSSINTNVYRDAFGVEFKPKERLGISLSVNYNMGSLDDNKFNLGYYYYKNNQADHQIPIPLSIFRLEIIPVSFSLNSTLYF